MPTHRPVMLVILDGWGWREERADNAVLQARTPTFDRLWATCPHALLHTSGNDVGLPPGQMGNSEVGHLNIGAGRVVMQELPRIDHAIESGELAKNPVLGRFIDKLKQSRRHLSPDGARVARRRALAPEPRRRAREDSRAGRHPGCLPRLHGRPRHAAARGRGVHGAPCRGPAAVGAHRDRHRPLLRDGSRQPLGARVEGLRGRRRRQGRALRRSGRRDRRRVQARTSPTSSSCRP